MDPTIEALIQSKIGNIKIGPGAGPLAGPYRTKGVTGVKSVTNPAYMRAWAADMCDWSRAVRRDILVLEYHLKNLAKYHVGTDLEMYGDPGDPPPPPET